MGGYMNYGPLNPTAVPTLGGWMLILLSLLLMAVAFKMAKKRGSSVHKLFITLIGVTALSFGGEGFKIVSDVEARKAAIELDNVGGGMVTIVGQEINYYENTSGVTQVVKSINLNGISCDGFPHNNGNTECSINLELSPHDECQIDCSQTGEN